jgi:hypothetical protein
MYEVLKKGRLHNLSIKSQYDLLRYYSTHKIYLVVTVDLMQNPKIKLHIVTQKVLNKYQILLRVTQLVN